MYFRSVLCFGPSAIDLAKRALVSLLRALAAALRRRADLEEGRARQGDKRPALGKTAWTVRRKRLLKTQKAQAVAKRKFQNFKKVCKVVYQRKGAHSGL